MWGGQIGLPYGPDAAVLYGGSILILKNDEYWHLYEDTDRDDIYVPKGYPKKIRDWIKDQLGLFFLKVFN